MVLDNMFMGEVCTIKRPESTLLYHRIPHNFESFDIKVAFLYLCKEKNNWFQTSECVIYLPQRGFSLDLSPPPKTVGHK